MKLSDLRAPITTEFELVDDEGVKLGVIIKGQTLATEKWEEAKSIYSIDDGVYLAENHGKKELKVGAPLSLDEKKAVAMLVTDIKGLDEFTFSEKAVMDIFTDPAHFGIPAQWYRHLKSLGNGFKKKSPSKKPKTT